MKVYNYIEEKNIESRDKIIVGKPKIYDFNNNFIEEVDNLVVFGGRKIIAKKLVNAATGSTWKFNIGDGGADANNKLIGPFDNDTALGNPKMDKKVVTSALLKDEEHSIYNLNGDNDIIESTETHKTTIEFVCTVAPNNIAHNTPFNFNEAGLYLGTALFARFTTNNKSLSSGDGLIIKWYLLV